MLAKKSAVTSRCGFNTNPVVGPYAVTNFINFISHDLHAEDFNPEATALNRTGCWSM